MSKLEFTLPHISELKPGDILLYDRPGFFGKAVKFKTWSDVSHCEVVVSALSSVSAREEGVNEFAIDLHGLRYVLRPKMSIDFTEGMKWFNANSKGQPYHYMGLFSFYLASLRGKDDLKQFCSESVARLLKHCGVYLLHPNKDSDTYAPCQFLDSPLVDYVWVKYVEDDWKISSEVRRLVCRPSGSS